MDRLATGISVLDRHLDGGLPVGSVVVLTADPASQSELFVNTFAAVRDCLYLTTVRSAAAVEDGFERSTTDVGETTVRSIGADEGPADAVAALSALPERSTLVIDSLAPLEAGDPTAYRRFLESVRSRAIETESIAVLHALRRDAPPAERAVSKQIADVVFDLRTTTSGTEVINRLAVPKFRGGAALEETMKLKLSDTVDVDTSRDIA